jgi:hypothetical protein
LALLPVRTPRIPRRAGKPAHRPLATPKLPRTVLRTQDRDPALEAGRQALELAARKARVWTAFRRGKASEAAQRAVLDRLRFDAIKAARQVTGRLIRGEVSRDAWQRSIRDALIARHYAAALASTGSLSLDPASRRSVEASIRTQLGFLARFRNDIAVGKQALDGTALNRVDLYGAAVYTGSQELRASQAIKQGMTEERAIRAALDSCETCLARTDGKRVGNWVPIGSQVPIGQGECLTRCRCYLEYRKVKKS